MLKNNNIFSTLLYLCVSSSVSSSVFTQRQLKPQRPVPKTQNSTTKFKPQTQCSDWKEAHEPWAAGFTHHPTTGPEISENPSE